MTPDQIMTIGVFGLTSLIVLTGLVITHTNINRDSDLSRNSGSSTIRNASFSESDMARDASISDRQTISQPRYEYTNTGRNSVNSDDSYYTAVGDDTRGGKKTKIKRKSKRKRKTTTKSKKNKKL
jgi:hypothetical protein